MSEFIPERPARLDFLNRLQALNQVFLSDALARMTVDEAGREELSEAMLIGFRDKDLQLPLMGADTVVLNAISPLEDGSGTGALVELDLYNDGSPWVPEEDLDTGGANEYAIFVSPDMPPVAINRAALDNNELRHDIAGLMAAQKLGASLHPLTDEECEVLIQKLPEAADEIDLQFLYDLSEG